MNRKILSILVVLAVGLAVITVSIEAQSGGSSRGDSRNGSGSGGGSAPAPDVTIPAEPGEAIGNYAATGKDSNVDGNI